MILSVLAVRARRWTHAPDSLVDAFLRFSRENPPPELITSALRAYLYAWCIYARFALEARPCHFFQAPDSDRQQHYLACPVLRRWIGDRFGVTAQPADGSMHAWLLDGLGGCDEEAMRAAVILDAALFTFDSRRNAVRSDVTALLDARLKETRRRHPQVWPMRVRAR